MGMAGLETQALRARCAARIMDLCKNDYPGDLNTTDDLRPLGWALCAPTGAGLGRATTETNRGADFRIMQRRLGILRAMRAGNGRIPGRLGVIIWVNRQAWAEEIVSDAEKVMAETIAEEEQAWRAGKRTGRMPATDWATGPIVSVHEVPVRPLTLSERPGWTSETVSSGDLARLAAHAELEEERDAVKALIKGAKDGAAWRLRRRTGTVRTLYLGQDGGSTEGLSLGDLLILWTEVHILDPRPWIVVKDARARSRRKRTTLHVDGRTYEVDAS